MSNRKRRQSRGEMISSVTFFGVALWLWGEVSLYEGAPLNRLLLIGAALSCLLAAFRFQIGQWVDRKRAGPDRNRRANED
jgi:hypothetical protein